MRYLHALLRHVLSSAGSRRTTVRRSALAAVATLLALVLVAVPGAVADRHSAVAKRHHHARGGGNRMSTYDRLVRLRRLGRKAPPGTHSRTAKLPGHEVAKLRKAQSRTFLRDDGTYVTRMFPLPVNFRDGHGRFQRIDNRLVPVGAASRRQGYAFENAANGYRAFLPANLRSQVLVAAHGTWLSFRTVGADAAAGSRGDSAGYAGALRGVNASYTATNRGLKETLTLADAHARSSFEYRIHASRGLRSRRNADGSIDFVGRRGRVTFRLPAPFAYDHAQGPDGASYSAVSQRLTRTHGGFRLRLRVKRSWLHAKGREFPVTVDPTTDYIENTGDTRLRTTRANLDCYVRDGDGANSNLCGGEQILVGWDGLTQRRSMLRFDVQNSIPKGIKVLDAELGLYMLDNDFDSRPATVNLHRITRSWTGLATWNKYDGTNAWTTAGGDFDSTVAASNTVDAWGQWYKWYPTSLVQGWIDGSITNNGVLVKEATERSVNNRFYFWSSQAPFSQLPYLDVVYEPQTGQRPYYKFEGRNLSDRMDLNVNVASGNMMLHASDVNIPGTGLDLGVDRYYNSMLEKVTDFGEGWTMGVGADVRIRTTSSSAILYAPSGYVVSFQKNADGSYSAPKGIDATLCLVNGTTCKGQSTYALTYNHAQIKNNFDSSGKLVSQRDKNDNQITYAYDTSGRLSTITDTQNRVLNVTTNTNGQITQLSDPTGRTWGYTYDVDQHLSTYTDPEGKITTYKYDSAGLIHEIDDPRGGVIWIWYDTTAMRRVTRVQRVNNNAPDQITDFAYSSGSSPCQTSDFGKTVLTDGNGHTTTYCYDDQGKVKTVFDAKGKKQQLSYSSNSFVATFTSANNSTSGFNTTVDRDSASNSVKSVTQATGGSSADPNLKSTFTYDQAGTNSYSPFYPQSSQNTQGHTQSYTYDTKGNMTTSKDDATTPNQMTFDYDPNHPGWLTKVTDANGHATTYGYDSVGNRTSVTPPTLAAGTGTQPGNTTIAYDSVSRPCVVKDGKGQRTAYTYDKLDRIKTLTKYPAGATSTGCTVTGTGSLSVALTYDANGNLTTRVDPLGTTTYAYNELNQLNSQSFPNGRVNDYTYDNVGSLKTVEDAGGITTYAYDADNLVASVAEPGGSCTTTPTTACTKFTVDDNGNRLTTTFPNGVVLTSKYDASDRLTCLMATNGAPSGSCTGQVSPLRRFVYTYEDGSATPKETGLRQTVTDQAGNKTTYTYDSLDRLKTATTRNSGGTITDDYTYTYDGAGNMLKRAAKANSGATTTTTFTYNNANELCWSGTGTYTSPTCATQPTGTTAYTYDANGNQTGASTGRGYGYNVFDQTISLTPPGGAAQSATYRGPNQSEMVTRGGDQYVDNVLGTSIKVYSDATVSYFTRDVSGALLAERAPGSAKYYFIPDGLGSTVATTTSTGAIANSYKYDPFGGVVSESETSVRPTSFRFAGGLYSSSVGLHKFGQRWYDQSIDRWSQQDAIDSTGDLKRGNQYLYVADNPINRTDPAGTHECGLPGPHYSGGENNYCSTGPDGGISPCAGSGQIPLNAPCNANEGRQDQVWSSIWSAAGTVLNVGLGCLEGGMTALEAVGPGPHDGYAAAAGCVGGGAASAAGYQGPLK